jgi:YVTN family beta-propeller protein
VAVTVTILAAPSAAAAGGSTAATPTQVAYVSSTIDNTVSVVNTATNTVTASIRVPQPVAAVANPAGTRLYVALGIDQVRVFNTADLQSDIARIPTIDRNPMGLAITADGTRIYVGTSGRLTVIDTATNRVTARISAQGTSGQVAISPDGTRAYVAAQVYGRVNVFNTINNTFVRSFNVGRSPNGIAVSPDGTRIYVANGRDGTVSVIDAVSGVVSTIRVGPGPQGVAVTPDGTRVYAVNSGDGTVSVINTSTGGVAQIAVRGTRGGEAVTPDGIRVYVTASPGGNGNTSVINTAGDAVAATIPLNTTFPRSITIANAPPGSDALPVTGGHDQTLAQSALVMLALGTILLVGTRRPRPAQG